MKIPTTGTLCPARVGMLLAAAVLSTSGVGAQTVAPAPTGPSFAIDRFQVDGNTLLPDAQVQALVAQHAGPARRFGDVRRAVQALQDAYRARGWSAVVVQLPEQELDGGVVRMRVVEPRIGRVTLRGNDRFSDDNIRASLPGLREGAIPNLGAISASLKVANTSPAKQTTLELQGGATEDTVDATVRVVEDKPWRVGLTADTTGTDATGRTRVGFLVQHANLWNRDHVASLQYTTSLEKPSQVSVFGAGYHLPLYALGDSMDFFASHSNVDSGQVSAGILNLLVSGQGSTAGVRYNRALPNWGGLASTLVIGADWRAYRSDVDLAGTQLGNDITVHPLSLTYSGQLALDTAALGFQLTGVQNIPGGSKGRDADFARERAGADASYRLLRFAASYSQSVAGGWLLRVQANGQASGEPLVSGEQFGAGGATSVRGFAEREVAGDSGAFAGAELETPNWCPQDAAVQCRAVAFIDAARVSRQRPQPGEARHTSISSAGIGLRLAVSRNASLQADLGRVIDGGGVRTGGDHRLHVGLALSY